jgi:hypothetical protein
MRDVLWRVGFTLTALTFLTILGPSAGCGVGSRLIELAKGQTPRARIAHYMTAVARGDRQRALALWALLGSSNADLQARRESVTDDLLAHGSDLEYRILDTVWWRTCCEPDVIDDPDEAGGARVRVAVSSQGRPERIYIFDVLVPGGYWGAAMGHPVRRWAIVDVYPEGEAPLIWPWSGR